MVEQSPSELVVGAWWRGGSHNVSPVYHMSVSPSFPTDWNAVSERRHQRHLFYIVTAKGS